MSANWASVAYWARAGRAGGEAFMKIHAILATVVCFGAFTACAKDPAAPAAAAADIASTADAPDVGTSGQSDADVGASTDSAGDADMSAPTDAVADSVAQDSTASSDTVGGEALVGQEVVDTSAGDQSTANDAGANSEGVGGTVDSQPADTSSKCPYVCNIKCVCKKDYQGCDIAECESAECMTVLGKIAALKPKLQACTAAKGCQGFEYPICGSAGCFQMPIGSDTDTSALSTLAQEAADAKCSSFHCGCGPAAPSFCLKGKCRDCPPDCDGTCDELATAIPQLAGQLGYCGKDDDCTVLMTGLCPIGGLPCGGIPLSKFAQTGQLQALLNQYAAPCNAVMCKCAGPGKPVCEKGKCVAPK